MVKILVQDITDPTKEPGVTEYDISMEEMEKVMDRHADRFMSQTLCTSNRLYFPDGRVVEYIWDEKEKCIYKRVGKLKKNETD